MINVMQQALNKIETLPKETQEICGKNILKNVDKLLRLRADVQEGLFSAQTERLYTMDEMWLDFEKKHEV